ncbi:2-amino-3-ketobutyrate CoA ligase, partial [archaeon]
MSSSPGMQSADAPPSTILDMAVHASVYEGVRGKNFKTFPHNNLEQLER